MELHIFGCPFEENEPTPRDDMLEMRTLRNEISLTETLEVLG